MRRAQERPRYPEYRDRVGEDPARFLASELDPEPRIEGIDDLGVANAWLQVARDLDVDPQVAQAIEQRRDEIIKNQ